MTTHNAQTRMRVALSGLQWSLGVVILIEAALFIFQTDSRHQFASTHLPNAVRLILGWGELIGALLLLIPATAVRAAWLLLFIFMLAILIHLLHGMPNVGSLVVYSAAAWAIAWGKA